MLAPAKHRVEAGYGEAALRNRATVTAGTVTSVEHVERRHLRRHDLTVGYRRAPGQGVTGGEAETDDDRDGRRE